MEFMDLADNEGTDEVLDDRANEAVNATMDHDRLNDREEQQVRPSNERGHGKDGWVDDDEVDAMATNHDEGED